MNPDFTIVTASYNYGHYIGECLESVVGQKGVTFEHLVFDGGSTDKTAEVVGGFPHASFVQEADRGMCDAINKGFRAARGKWVMWLNADDRLLPGALAAVKQFAENHNRADVIYGGWNFINGEGSFMHRMTVFPYKQGMMCYLGCYIGSTSAFYRRQTILDERLYLNEDFHYVMDGEYYARLFSLGKKFVYFPRIIAEFRWHNENISSRNHGVTDVSGWLRLQKQYAESRAIRRAYGGPSFKNEYLNGFADTLVYLYWRLIKITLKRIHLFRLRKD